MGTFCWDELATIDQDGAKAFYSAIFGWTPVDFPMGPGEVYTTFKLNGGDAGAAYTMRDPERSMAPPHWNLYIAVEDADQSASRATELGGTVLMSPFDVMTFGRMAVIQDPSGAVFCIWQKYEHVGTTVEGEPGTVCWADLSTAGPDRAKKFYEGLFGWKIGPRDGYPHDYDVIDSGGKLIGGVPPAAHRDPQIPAHWMPFFLVTDVDAVAEKTRTMGGKVCMAPTSMGNVRLSVMTDPQGAAFSVIKQ